MWIPDAYQGAPTIVSALLSAGTKGAVFAPAARILFIVFAAKTFQADWSITFATLAVLSMTLGNFAALTQKHVTRILAYSSIGQAGYILIGFAVATNYSVTASVFQIFAHAFMFIGALAVIAHMEMQNRHEVNDYIGLYSENKFAAIALTIMFISMIGTPLTAGFIGKFLLFSSAVYHNMLPLAVLAITASVISVYYYLKVIMAMFTNKEFSKKSRMRINLLIVALICLIVIVAVGIYPNPVISLAGSAASALNMT
jgi:NADH-quinone oxidoreductase subunit N